MEELLDELIKDRLKQLCQECHRKKQQEKLSMYNYQISIPPKQSNLSFNFDFSDGKENMDKSNQNKTNFKQINIFSNQELQFTTSKHFKSPSSVSQKSNNLQLDPKLFLNEFNIMKSASSPTQKKRKISSQWKSTQNNIKKEDSTTIYEKILKGKK